MKNQALLFSILLAILFCCVGYYTYPVLAKALLPITPRVQYIITSPGSFISHALVFGLGCGLIPLLLYFIWQFTGTDKIGKRLSAFIVLFVAATALFVHYWIVRDIIDTATGINVPNVVNTFDLANLMYHIYLLIGLLIGGTVAFYVLQKRKT